MNAVVGQTFLLQTTQMDRKKPTVQSLALARERSKWGLRQDTVSKTAKPRVKARGAKSKGKGKAGGANSTKSVPNLRLTETNESGSFGGPETSGQPLAKGHSGSASAATLNPMNASASELLGSSSVVWKSVADLRYKIPDRSETWYHRIKDSQATTQMPPEKSMYQETFDAMAAASLNASKTLSATGGRPQTANRARSRERNVRKIPDVPIMVTSESRAAFVPWDVAQVPPPVRAPVQPVAPLKFTADSTTHIDFAPLNTLSHKPQRVLPPVASGALLSPGVKGEFESEAHSSFKFVRARRPASAAPVRQPSPDGRWAPEWFPAVDCTTPATTSQDAHRPWGAEAFAHTTRSRPQSASSIRSFGNAELRDFTTTALEASSAIQKLWSGGL